MKILSDHQVSGMVPYKAAWEIPACTVMELIHGPNLEDAVQSGYIDSWNMILRVSIDLVATLRSAHQLPERVLHRDVRPPNVMLQGFYDNPNAMQVVVLDFDLAWHRDASGLSVNLGKSSHGYVAPEQLGGTRQLTRNALVDSFGLGMTLYFLVSGKPPLASQHVHKEWDKLLRERVVHRQCSEWRCLPRRFARLILWATQDEQSKRWDMTRIFGELSQLNECLKKPLKLTSLELLAEEIAARCPRMAGEYTWDLDKASAFLELKSGFTIRLQPNWVKREIRCYIEWLHAGDRSYKDVRKFVGPAADKVCAELKSGGWRIPQKHVESNQCRVECSISPNHANSIPTIQKSADSLSEAIDILRFN